MHGPVFAEVVYGLKVWRLRTDMSMLMLQRWLLYAPDERPVFDPDLTTLEWVTHNYTQLSRLDMPYECVLKPGEVRPRGTYSHNSPDTGDLYSRSLVARNLERSNGRIHEHIYESDIIPYRIVIIEYL